MFFKGLNATKFQCINIQYNEACLIVLLPEITFGSSKFLKAVFGGNLQPVKKIQYVFTRNRLKCQCYGGY